MKWSKREFEEDYSRVPNKRTSPLSFLQNIFQLSPPLLALHSLPAY